MKKIVEILIVVVLLSGSSLIAMKKAEASQLNFSVQTELPTNQLDTKKSYFDLLMVTNQKQTVQIALNNDTDQAITINAEIHSATTNSGGVVEYGESKSQKDDSLVHDIKELIEVTECTLVPAKSSVKLPVTIQMPKEKVLGQVVGGITLKEQQEERTQQTAAKEIAIDNRYSYAVAIVLQESQEDVEPELILNQVEAGQKNFRNVIKANLQNSTPTFVNKLAVNTTITKKGQKEVLYKETKNDLQMAPNSNFDLPIPLNGEKLTPGAYTLAMEATSKKHKWKWQKEFTIKAEEAKELNAKDVTIKTDYGWLLYLVLAVLSLVVIVLLVLLTKKQKQSKQSEK